VQRRKLKRPRPEGSAVPPQVLAWEASAWITTGTLAALLWIVLFVFLGIKTLRKGHWVMFLIGIVLPIFWIIGALIPARR
jgi:hypothetical protein